MTNRLHGYEEKLEAKLETEGFNKVGKAIFKDGLISIKLSEYWRDILPLELHDYEHRFVPDYCLPNQSKLELNELYIYARKRPL